jgi:hypothetical protein
VAAPCFDYYEFKPTPSPLEQLKTLMDETIAIYNSRGTSDEPGDGAQVFLSFFPFFFIFYFSPVLVNK